MTPTLFFHLRFLDDNRLNGGLEHLKIETRLRGERFESVKGECVLEAVGAPSIFKLILLVFLLQQNKKRQSQGKYVTFSTVNKTHCFSNFFFHTQILSPPFHIINLYIT